MFVESFFKPQEVPGVGSDASDGSSQDRHGGYVVSG